MALLIPDQKIIRVLFFVLLFVISLPCNETDGAQGQAETISALLRNRFSFLKPQQNVVCRGETLCSSIVLPTFYSGRDFFPVWISNQGVCQQAYDFLNEIKKAALEGLIPQDYHVALLLKILEQVQPANGASETIHVETLTELELLLTDSFLLYTSHLSSGRVNPRTIHSDWSIKVNKADLIQLLDNAIALNRIEAAISEAKPQNPDYQRLQKAFVRYAKIVKKNGWGLIPNGPKIQMGDTSVRVGLLRLRLKMSGDLEDDEAQKSVFDEVLHKAVVKFQQRHGLTMDGIVGPATLSALNFPAEKRLMQIQVNMERRRWLPRDSKHRYLVVNIADFKLGVIEEGVQMLDMRVVVGKDFRRTPVFTGDMTYLVINPSWKIPHKLALKDILPKVKTDPEFFKTRNIRVYESWRVGAEEIDPETVEWKNINANNFAYKLVQVPGPMNPLGRIKFIFPNRYSVYLHDTPARNHFHRSRRTFSSGCIRIEKPVDLAAYLLFNDPKWTREAILNEIAGAKTTIIRLPQPISVHILYFTAWVDDEGRVNFRDDIYGRDGRVFDALREVRQ